MPADARNKLLAADLLPTPANGPLYYPRTIEHYVRDKFFILSLRGLSRTEDLDARIHDRKDVARGVVTELLLG